MASTTHSPERLKRRRNFSELMIVIMVGVAFEQMAHSLGHPVIKNEALINNSLIAIIFFFTSIRFLIGDHFHLQNDALAQHGNLWFADLMCIGVEMFILIFIGNACNVEESALARLHFIKLIIVLLSVDIVWVLSQQLTRAKRGTLPHRKKWLRRFLGISPIPWEWAILNSLFILAVLILHYFVPNLYSQTGLFGLAILSVGAFALDVNFTDFPNFISRDAEYGKDEFMQAAIDEAEVGRQEQGIPIGSVLVRDGQILARGRNRRVQDKNPMMHAEINCLTNAGRMTSYRDTTLYSTLMPCHLCAGAVIQFGIRRVIAGEAETFPGAKEYMRAHGVEVINLDLDECRQAMEVFIAANRELWNEDIGR